MRGKDSIFSRVAITAVLLAAASAGTSALAQAGGSWSLPDPNATGAARPQGPVDAQNPVLRPGGAVEPPAPVPTITPPAPAPAPSASTPATRSPATPAPTPRATATRAPRPAASATPAPALGQGIIAPSETPSADASPFAPEATSPAQPAASQPPVTPVVPATSESWPFWIWAGPLALLAALGALALYLRRQSTPVEPEWEDAPHTTTAHLDPPAEIEPAAPVAAPAPSPIPQPSFAKPPEAATPAQPTIELAFEPVGLRLSLVYATLQYRVAVTARDALPAGHLLGDMIGAHGSLTPAMQLAPPPEALTPLRPLAALAAGETVVLTGEIQLPLSAIRTLTRGSASLFVPLVRLCLVFGDQTPALRRVFTLGTPGDGPALAPVRLDTGPREVRDLAAREVEAARDYPVPAAVPRAAAV